MFGFWFLVHARLIAPESDHHALRQTPAGFKRLNPRSISQRVDEFSCRHSTGLCCLNSHNRIVSLKQISSKCTRQSSCIASAVNSWAPPAEHRLALPVFESLRLEGSLEAAAGWWNSKEATPTTLNQRRCLKRPNSQRRKEGFYKQSCFCLLMTLSELVQDGETFPLFSPNSQEQMWDGNRTRKPSPLCPPHYVPPIVCVMWFQRFFKTSGSDFSPLMDSFCYRLRLRRNLIFSYNRRKKLLAVSSFQQRHWTRRLHKQQPSWQGSVLTALFRLSFPSRTSRFLLRDNMCFVISSCDFMTPRTVSDKNEWWKQLNLQYGWRVFTHNSCIHFYV